MCLFSPHKHKRPTTTISLSRPDGRWAWVSVVSLQVARALLAVPRGAKRVTRRGVTTRRAVVISPPSPARLRTRVQQARAHRTGQRSASGCLFGDARRHATPRDGPPRRSSSRKKKRKKKPSASAPSLFIIPFPFSSFHADPYTSQCSAHSLAKIYIL